MKSRKFNYYPCPFPNILSKFKNKKPWDNQLPKYALCKGKNAVTELYICRYTQYSAKN